MIPQRILNPILNPILDNILDSSTGLSFYNLYGNLPVVLGANESAGLVTNANATGEPYGADVVDSWDFTSGYTAGANATIDDADSFTTTAGAEITKDVAVLEVGSYYQVQILGTSSTTIKVGLGTTDLSGFATQTGQCVGTSVLSIQNVGAGTTNVTHFKIRKLTGPSSALLSEIDRTLRANGTELHTDANAASDPSGNEADATTGFTSVKLTGEGANVFESQGAVKNTGSYAIHTDANDTPSDGALFWKDIETDWGLSNGDVVQVTFNWRHIGLGGRWESQFNDTNTSASPTLRFAQVVSTETTFKPVVVEFTYSADYKYLVVTEFDAGATNDGGVYFDNLSAQIMQPTASLIERVDNAETFLIDNEPVDYSAGALLELVKDGLTATAWFNKILLGEVTIDSALQYNVIHSDYGDSTGSATIIPLRFGPTIATGTLTVDILYEIITTEVDHFGTGLEAGDYFISDGTETCDANNTVHAVNTE